MDKATVWFLVDDTVTTREYEAERICSQMFFDGRMMLTLHNPGEGKTVFMHFRRAELVEVVRRAPGV